MKKIVYYLPGMGGRLDTGLGLALLSRGFNLQGRELTGEFRKLHFGQQVDCVVTDLRSIELEEGVRVIANSFGAYLLLHALAQMPPFMGKVLLLSPIVGQFSNEATQMGFVPPRAELLDEMARAGAFPTPSQGQIHVGADDWQSDPENVKAFGTMVGIAVTVVASAGHSLPKAYVGGVLDGWFSGDR
jgi:alpha-beta hydrolase superfamily lysophospholipase